MDQRKRNDLKNRIIEEMTVDYSGALEKNFDLAKNYVRITTDGTVDVLVKDSLTGKEQILLYLIGKLYAKEAGFAETHDVANRELMDELGMPKGSVLPALKDLRDSNEVEQTRRGRPVHHAIPVSLVAKTLQAIERKLSEGT